MRTKEKVLAMLNDIVGLAQDENSCKASIELIAEETARIIRNEMEAINVE